MFPELYADDADLGRVHAGFSQEKTSAKFRLNPRYPRTILPTTTVNGLCYNASMNELITLAPAVAEALAACRPVVALESTVITHGLPYLRDWSTDATPPGWSRDFDLWAAEALDRGDIDALSDYQSAAPGMPYAHPSVEHFVPLFITLGLATNPGDIPDTTIDGYFFGLAKRSIQVA